MDLPEVKCLILNMIRVKSISGLIIKPDRTAIGIGFRSQALI